MRTIAEVANSLVGGDIPLGIIPLGTGNVLSLELRIPADVRQALDLVVANVRGPLDYLRLAWRLLLGRHQPGPSLRYFPVRKEALIETRRPLPIQADGEIIGKTPLSVAIVPSAIRVVVPKRARSE